MTGLEFMRLWNDGLTFIQISRLCFTRWRFQYRRVGPMQHYMPEPIGEDIEDWPRFHPRANRIGL